MLNPARVTRRSPRERLAREFPEAEEISSHFYIYLGIVGLRNWCTLCMFISLLFRRFCRLLVGYDRRQHIICTVL